MLTSQSDGVSVCDASPHLVREVASTATRRTPDQSFPRTARLLKGGDYARVFTQNTRFSDKYWTILVKQVDSGPSRLGLAIAKKRARRAVDRNRIKRIAREAFRLRRSTLPGLELVVMNRDAATRASHQELRDSIDRLLGKMSRAASRSDSHPTATGD